MNNLRHSKATYENKYKSVKEKANVHERGVFELGDRIETLEGEKTQLEEERDDYKAEWCVLGRQINEMQSGQEASGTPSVVAPSVGTGNLAVKSQKSEKVADPPVLLKEDGIANVAGRVGGEAADHLRPYLDEGKPMYAELAHRLFAKLDEVYRDLKDGMKHVKVFTSSQ